MRGHVGSRLALCAALAACASTSTSEVRAYVLGSTEVRVSARAERGTLEDRLVIVVNDVDVASGPFGFDQAAGTTLRGDFDGTPVVAQCGHRWRPGLHIGYRCAVRLGEGEPVELSF